MSTTVYDVGDTVRLSCTIQSSTGGYTAATVRLIVNAPDGDETLVAAGALTSTATGRYRYDVVPDVGGRWRYRFESTGAIVGAEQGAFAVRPRIASTA